MATQGITSKQYFQSLKIIFLVIMMVSVIFPGAIFLLEEMPDPAVTDPEGTEADMTSLVVVSVTSVTFIIMSFFMKQVFVAKARNAEELGSKALKYRTALILQYAFLETAAIFIAAMSLILMSEILLVLCIIPIVLLFMNRPSVLRMAQQLQLTAREAQMLTQPDFIISQYTYTNNS